MKTIFISGSRNIHTLNTNIEKRINNVIKNNFLIIIGDANGVDKITQDYLVNKKYKKVEIYCSGKNCRNNLGFWKLNYINSNKKGRAFFEEKDKAMAEVADYGFIIWNGESIGSLNNIAELVSKGKKSLLYYSPYNDFITISTNNHLKELIDKSPIKLTKNIEKKGSPFLKNIINQQEYLPL